MAETRRLDIRKYPNRRYYDSTRSKHLTLEQIHGLIRDGYEIRVTDSKSGEDITAKVLAQIILELDPPKLSVFPAELLHRLIRANEQLVTDFTEKYFSNALSAFLESRRHFELYLREALNLGKTESGSPDWMRLVFGGFPAAWNPPAPGGKPAVPAGVPSAEADLRRELRDLRAELETLRKSARARRKR